MIGLFISLIIAIQCLKSAKEEQVCPKSMYSLALVCTGWFLTSLVGLLQKTDMLNSSLHVSSIIISTCIFLAGFILAIVALSTYQSEKFIRGRKQSISSIIISVFFVSCFGVGLVKGMNGEPSKEQLTSDSKIKSKQVFPEFNFKYTHSGSPYIKLKAATINEAAEVVRMKSGGKYYSMIIAEADGIAESSTIDVFYDFIAGRLAATLSESTTAPKSTCLIQGEQATCTTISGKLNGRIFTYNLRILLRKGALYQFFTWTNEHDAQELFNESELFCNGFQLLDPDKIYSDESMLLKPHSSDLFSYKIDLSSSSWAKWEEHAEQCPEADFGAATYTGESFSIVPLFLGDKIVENSAVANSLLSHYDLDLSDNSIYNLRTLQENEYDTYLLSSSRTIDGEKYIYHFKIIRRKNTAYLLATWGDYDSPLLKKHPQELYDAFQLIPEANSLNITPMTEIQKIRQATCLNKLGLTHYKNEDYKSAKTAFEEALTLNPSDTTYATNICSTYNKLDNTAGLLDFIKRQETLMHSPELKSWQAWALNDSGETAESLAIYEQLFSTDYSNDEDVGLFLNLLAQEGQLDNMKKITQRYFSKESPLSTRMLYPNALSDYEYY